MNNKVKIVISIAIKMLLGGVVGFLFTIFMYETGANFDTIFSNINDWFVVNGVTVYAIVSFILIATLVYLYRKGKRIYLKQDEEGEYLNKDNIYMLSFTITYSVLMVFSFTFLGLMYSQLLELDLANSLLMLFMFLLNTFVTTYCEFKLVKVIQEKEPLLITKTDPSSFKFQKEYFSKLDEAQKLHQTTAAYKSSRVMLMVILGAFITSVVLNMIFESFSNSVIFLGIILIINLIVHNIYAYEK